MGRRKVVIDFDDSDSLDDILRECGRVLNKSPFKIIENIEVIFDKGFYRATITEYQNHTDRIALVVEFQEPHYYVGCGNCEAEVVGKYCMECGCRLIYESEGE